MTMSGASRVFLVIPFLILTALAGGGCDGDNILAQEPAPTQEPEPGPGPGAPEEATTEVSGTVLAPNEDECPGIDGIPADATVDFIITQTGSDTGTASVTLSGAATGTIACETQGANDQIDTPPLTFIICTVTSVNGISGVAVGDTIELGVTFDFSSLTKEAGLILNNTGCSAVEIGTMVVES